MSHPVSFSIHVKVTLPATLTSPKLPLLFGRSVHHFIPVIFSFVMHVTHISNFNAATFRARKTFVESKSYVLLIKEFSPHLCFFLFSKKT